MGFVENDKLEDYGIVLEHTAKKKASKTKLTNFVASLCVNVTIGIEPLKLS